MEEEKKKKCFSKLPVYKPFKRYLKFLNEPEYQIRCKEKQKMPFKSGHISLSGVRAVQVLLTLNVRCNYIITCRNNTAIHYI